MRKMDLKIALYIYIYIYIYIYVYIYNIYINVYVYIYMYMYTYIYTYIFAFFVNVSGNNLSCNKVMEPRGELFVFKMSHSYFSFFLSRLTYTA